jgi:hypothetical protein
MRCASIITVSALIVFIAFHRSSINSIASSGAKG